MNSELSRIFAQIAELSSEISKLCSRAAELAGGVEVEDRESKELLRQTINDAVAGDVQAIFKLKEAAKENSVAKWALEKLYYDGDKKNAVGTIILREGLKYIEQNEFSGLKNVTKIILPEGLVNIGDNAFDGCISLEEIYFPRSLNFIGYSVFWNCNS